MPTNDPHPTARALVEACPFCGYAEPEPGIVTSLRGARYFVNCQECDAHGPECFTRDEAIKRWNAALTAAHDAGRREGGEKALKQAAAAVPTNWVDSLLSGPDGLGMPSYDCRDVERLLRAIKARIEQLPLDDTARGEEP